jgi:hypothetical protein
MNPRYPVFIPSRGRPGRNQALTARTLARDGVPFRLVVEPQEAEDYWKLLQQLGLRPEEYLRILPDDVAGTGSSTPARNWIRLSGESLGAARHWQLDDNIIEFRRLYRGRRIPCHAGVALRVCEDFSDRFENVAVSGLNYQMFVPAETPVPFYVNVHVYSCVAPQTPILCADLAWRAAGTLRPGDRVVAFDEDPIEGDGRAARRYRTATIERNDPEVKSCRRVETDVGDPIVASDEHPWLVYRDGRLRWVETEDLHVGDQLAHLARPWERDESHEGGWIAGIFDGEGSMVIRQRETARTYSVAIGIAQREGPVLDRLRAALARRGYSVWMGDGDPEGRGGTHLRGGFAETLRFAGQFRPTRIVERVESMWEGRKLWRGSTYELATITSISEPSPYPVASISTSTGTFITGGYLTHNCTLVNHAWPGRWRLNYNEDTDLCLQALADGWCTVALNAFMANKMRTMAMGGGNTESLYRTEGGSGATDTDGRFEMARVLERAWPGLVTARRKFGRYQHSVNWRKFTQTLKLRDDVDLAAFPPVQESGMTLREVKAIKAPAIRELLETYERERACSAVDPCEQPGCRFCAEYLQPIEARADVEAVERMARELGE